MEKLQQMLAEAPSDSFLLHALALEHIKKGEDQVARNYFEQLLHNNPSYVGSYYHLAKLLERVGEQQAAVATYEKGMMEAKEANDLHAFNELRSAWEELTF
jgi:Tfp pilus assembly protein PilF